MLQDGFFGILTAGGRVAAGGRKIGRNAVLVKQDRQGENFAYKFSGSHAFIKQRCGLWNHSLTVVIFQTYGQTLIKFQELWPSK